MSSDEEDLSAEPLQLYTVDARWAQSAAASECWNILPQLKKIHISTSNSTATHRHNDELRNMFFKGSPSKIASLKNYDESHKQNEHILIWCHGGQLFPEIDEE